MKRLLSDLASAAFFLACGGLGGLLAYLTQ